MGNRVNVSIVVIATCCMLWIWIWIWDYDPMGRISLGERRDASVLAHGYGMEIRMTMAPVLGLYLVQYRFFSRQFSFLRASLLLFARFASTLLTGLICQQDLHCASSNATALRLGRTCLDKPPHRQQAYTRHQCDILWA
jgi:hypothetical protein